MYIDERLIKEDDILERALKLESYNAELLLANRDTSTPMGFFATVLHPELLPDFESKIEKLKNAKYFFVFGIGGSDLASKALWQAKTLHKNSESKKAFFIESLDNREREEAERIIQNEVSSSEDIALIVISKSGKTSETLDSFENIFDIASEKFGRPIDDRVLAIASEGSTLHQIATSRNITFLNWSGTVGGRYSAFTIAHLVVLKLLDINTVEYLEGARSAVEKYLNSLPQNNKALILASQLSLYYENGYNILDLFLFNEELECVGSWVRQLVAESLGKENTEGVPTGITPTVSVGPRDLHSQLELYLGGPKVRYTIFVKSDKEIRGTVAEEAYQNTKTAYERESMPHEVYEMSEINEKNVAEFFVFMMLTIVYLAKFLKVNAFDQPAVEEYKKHLIA